MKVGAKVFPLTQEEIEQQTGTSRLVARGSLYINDDFVVNNIRIHEWGNELIVNMPSHFNRETQEYQETVFPITAEAREQINKCVIEAYRNPDPQEKKFVPTACKTKIEASLHPVSGANSNIKAVGQIVLDDSLVIQNVRVTEGEKGAFLGMPGRTDKFGEWHDFANPITADAYEKLNDAVMSAYNKAGHIESNVAKYSDLGAKEDLQHINKLDNDYAKLLCERLNANNIRYSARVTNTTSIAVNKEDVTRFKEISDQARNDFKNGQRAQTAEKAEIKETAIEYAEPEGEEMYPF